MATIFLCSVAGSPGVTTTAVGLAEAWPRPVILVEADPSKPSSVIPGFMQGQLDNTRGLLPLAVQAQRQGLTNDIFWDQLVPLAQDLERAEGERRKFLLPGMSNVAAAKGMTGLWAELAIVLSQQSDSGVDVIVDAGRFAAGDARTPLAQMADSVLVLARPTLPDLAALDGQIGDLGETLARVGHEDRLGLVLMEGAVGNYGSREIERYLKVPTIGKIGWDPTNAAVYSLGIAKARGFKRSGLVSAMTALAASTDAQIRDRTQRLGNRPVHNEEVSQP
jgi:cellulose biosynthesis protein BcsQ